MNHLNRCVMKPTHKPKKTVSRRAAEKSDCTCKGSKPEKRGRVMKSSLETHRRKNKVNQRNILNVVKKVCTNRPTCANVLRINPSTDSIIYIGTVSQFKCESIIDLTKSSSNESLPSVKDTEIEPPKNTDDKIELNRDAVLQIDLKSTQTEDDTSDFLLKDLNLQDAQSKCSMFNCSENAHELSKEDLNIIESTLKAEEEKTTTGNDTLENINVENFVDVSMDINTMCNLYYIDDDVKKS